MYLWKKRDVSMIKYLKTAMSVEMSHLWGILNAIRTEPKDFNHMSFNTLRNAAHLFLLHVKHSSHRHMVFQYFTCENINWYVIWHVTPQFIFKYAFWNLTFQHTHTKKRTLYRRIGFSDSSHVWHMKYEYMIVFAFLQSKSWPSFPPVMLIYSPRLYLT